VFDQTIAETTADKTGTSLTRKTPRTKVSAKHGTPSQSEACTLNTSDLYRRAATCVDKILKGTKPAIFRSNRRPNSSWSSILRTAKALGLDIPPILLARADGVIE
jgi:ABC-type uncharacterized transport system substrate-binding protein